MLFKFTDSEEDIQIVRPEDIREIQIIDIEEEDDITKKIVAKKIMTLHTPTNLHEIDITGKKEKDILNKIAEVFEDKIIEL